jgi:hypothetical protein
MHAAVSDDDPSQIPVGIEVNLEAVLPVATSQIEVLVDPPLFAIYQEFAILSVLTMIVLYCVTLIWRILREVSSLELIGPGAN